MTWRSGDHDRLADDLSGEIVAGLLDPVLSAHAQPFVIEQRFGFEGVEGGVRVAGGRQRLSPVQADHRRRHAVEEGVAEDWCGHGRTSLGAITASNANAANSARSCTSAHEELDGIVIRCPEARELGAGSNWAIKA